MNRNNWISDRSSTRIHHRPGGNSTFSLGWGEQGGAGRGAGQPGQAGAQQAPNAGMGIQQPNTAMQQCNMGMQQPNMKCMVQPPCGQAPQVAAQAARNQPNVYGPWAHLGKTNSTDVMQFTLACGTPVPPRPTLMAPKDVDFITEMILDELLELQATVRGPAQAKATMSALLQKAENVPQVNPNDQMNLIAEQGDALVDIYYYSQNAACKQGVNLSQIFDVVHAANMAKIDPSTGKVIRRPDNGKVLKPPGWTPPNVKQEIMRQTNQANGQQF